ncbi:MAG TPA: GNAT family N-acetyltransferase [Gaiellales bacterium]|nr:GNAT family N-acetyltransferase [Gaiellales bacterium]
MVLISRSTAELTPEQRSELRLLFDRAWAGKGGTFDDDDWQAALGGTHFILEEDGRVLSHASVVERTLEVAGRPVRAGYVEAVATLPDRQGEGHATRVMAEVNAFIDREYELGALGAAAPGFYARMGWAAWRGRTAARTIDGVRMTPEEDGHIFVRPAQVADVGPETLLVCQGRPGDSW